MISATDLKVDNSSLTGESEPQERFPLPDGSTHRAVEAENLVILICYLTSPNLSSFKVFNSTLIVNGEGWGGKSLHSIEGVFQTIFFSIKLLLELVTRPSLDRSQI